MIFLVFLTATLISTHPPTIVKTFANEKSCLAVAAELNTMPQVNTPAAIKAGAGFVCLRVVDASA